MTAPDLTKLTAKELHDMLSTGLTSWTPPLYAVMREFVRRAEGYALACADRDSARDELAEMKALRDAAKSDHKEACRILRNYQTLAEERGREINALIRERDELHRRAQANDRLRSAAQAVLSWLNGEALEQYPSLAAEATHDVEPLRCNLETALAAAPAAPPTPAAPVTDAEIEAAITALTVDARREADALRVNPEASGTATEKRANRQVQLRALIARRVASAGAAPVDGDIIPLREAFDHLRTAYDALRAEINECHVFLATRGIAPERPLLERIKQCMRPAPVDSEREAAIEAWRKRATPRKSIHITEGEEFRALVDDAVRLMRSAPPAPAAGDQDAKLRELRAWIVSRSDVPGSHGIVYSTVTREHLAEIDRLLAAQAASAIAAAPEAPAWLEKLRVATNRMVDAAGYAASSLLSDVDIDLKDVRDFAFALREQVESHARRIEALERAAQEAGK